MRESLKLGRAAATWAGGFYLRHFALVFGLSLIPTLQRFAIVRWDPPAAVSVTSEVLVALVRILLVALAVRLMVLDLAAAGIGGREARARLKAGIDARRIAFFGQWGLLAAAFLIFDLVPNTLIATTVPASSQDIVIAWVVALKNPTIIAFTLLWMVGIAHALIVDPEPAADPVETT